MDYDNHAAYGMTESLFTSLKDIFEAIIAHDSRIGVVSPHKFLEILRRENEMFRTPMHQDAHEFLNLLLNEVVENVEQFSKQLEAKPRQLEETDSANGTLEVVSPFTTSTMIKGQRTRWVHELFEGTLTSETRCLTCENVSQRDEVFLDLSVDLEQHSSVTSCLRRFSEEEMLCEKNKFHCDKCGGLQEAEKRMKIKRLPRILALHLKRFKYTEDMQRLQKLFHRVVYPYYLRLFNTTDDAEDPDRLYELYAVVVHIGGGPYHGHYVSIIKTQDRGWLLFDDEMVEPVDKKFVTKFFGEGHNAQGHPNALATSYVLFYQETTMEAMQAELESEGISPAAATAELNRDSIPMSAKANGNVPNGAPHPPVPSTPLSEDAEHFVSLDHAATTPALAMHTPPQPTTAGPFQHNLEPVQTSPALPFLKRRKSKSELLAKKDAKHHEKEEKERLKEEKERLREVKERAKEEKERRKQEEKENERLAKLKKKEMEHAKKDHHKRQEEEVVKAYKIVGSLDVGAKGILSGAVPIAGTGGSSSNASSRAGDDEYGTPGPAVTASAPTPVSVAPPMTAINRGPSPAFGLGLSEDYSLPPAPTSHPHQNGATTTPSTNNLTPAGSSGLSGAMLHRFRNTSMSMRQKPKFWQSNKEREKVKDKGRSSGEHSYGPSHTFTAGEEYAVQGPGGPAPILGGMKSMPSEFSQNHGTSAHPNFVSASTPHPPPPPVSVSLPSTTSSYSEGPVVQERVTNAGPSYAPIGESSNGDKSWGSQVGGMLKREKSGKKEKENGHGHGSRFGLGRKKSLGGLLG
jgi:ubiquitin C-terminal hydrolase